MSRGTHTQSLKASRRSIVAGVSLLAISVVSAHGQDATNEDGATENGDTRLAPIVVTTTAEGQPPATGTV
ncbi:MAG: hypothetical protein ACK40W_09055, partial [Allorhizobium sp.]